MLHVKENKGEIFHNLSQAIEAFYAGNKMIVSAQDDSAITAGWMLCKTCMEFLQYCAQEEADTRILLHVAYFARLCHGRIAIKTVDTNVVVLAIWLFHALHEAELWVYFGVVKSFRYIAVHTLENILDIKAKALPMFHALTRCDTVSSIYGWGKKSAWATWMACPAATVAFLTLPSLPTVSAQVLHEIHKLFIQCTCRIDCRLLGGKHFGHIFLGQRFNDVS